MSAIKGRSARPPVEGRKLVPLQARVEEAAYSKAQRAADAAGISLSVYVQTLIDSDETDANGCPTWRVPRDHGQEELPLKTA